MTGRNNLGVTRERMDETIALITAVVEWFGDQDKIFTSNDLEEAIGDQWTKSKISSVMSQWIADKYRSDEYRAVMGERKLVRVKAGRFRFVHGTVPSHYKPAPNYRAPQPVTVRRMPPKPIFPFPADVPKTLAEVPPAPVIVQTPPVVAAVNPAPTITAPVSDEFRVLFEQLDGALLAVIHGQLYKCERVYL
jgi:hypothetical protein